jgi:hypothetical protein
MPLTLDRYPPRNPPVVRFSIGALFVEVFIHRTVVVAVEMKGGFVSTHLRPLSARGGRMVHAVLEPAVRREAGLVLIQKPRGQRKWIARDRTPATFGSELWWKGDGSRLDSGATGYAVVWQNGQSWVGIKTHMGKNQEGVRCIGTSLGDSGEVANGAEENHYLHRRPSCHRRMALEEPGPGQKYVE